MTHRHRFEIQVPAAGGASWITFYNQQHPDKALKWMIADAAYAAKPSA